MAAESARYFLKAGYLLQRTPEGMEYIASLLPMAVGSVDRLEEIPERLQFLFDFNHWQWEPPTLWGPSSTRRYANTCSDNYRNHCGEP